MKIPRASLKMHASRRILLIIAICILLIAAIAGYVLWQKHSFTTVMQQKQQKIEAVLADYGAFFKQDTDAKEVRKHLETTAKKIAAHASPQEIPSILGIPLIDEAQRKKDVAQAEAVGRTQKAMMAAAGLLAYEQAVLTKLEAVSNKDGKSLDEQKQLADMWRKAVQDIMAITPPATLKTQHEDLVKNVKIVESVAVTLPNLMQKNDYVNFMAKQKDLSAAVDGLRAQSTVFAKLHNQYDLTLSEAILALRQSFKK